MKSTAGWQGSANGSLIVDEVGIEFGSCGKFRLRCFYEPVFERRGCLLHKVALEGAVLPLTAGRQVPYQEFLKSQHSHDPYDVELMRQVLQVRNYRNIGVGGPQLHLDLAPLIQVDRSRFPHALAGLAGHMRDIGLDPQLVVCKLASSIPDDWPGLTGEIRKQGLGVAIGDFGAARWTEEQFNAVCPDLVRVDEAWFGGVCRYEATIRLFGTAVARLRERSARVLVKGIDSREKLHVAMRSGADLFQGPLLAGISLVGTEVNEEPLQIVNLLGDSPAVAQLFG
jgi:EAL domain-containing protein (putative c-di-GMP-specific phosphodiesterase class I)